MVIHLSSKNFQKEVLEAKIPTLVDFWASWCGPCIMFAPIFEKTSEKYSGKVKFAKLEVDASPKIANQFKVMSIPALILFRQEEEISRQVGSLTLKELKKWLDENLKEK